MRAEASPTDELCSEKSSSLVYEESEHPVSKGKKVRSRKRKLPSPIIFSGNEKRKFATPSGGAEEEGVREA